MIRYRLKCEQTHSFDSWFQSAAAYESLAGTGRVSCPICGTTTVEKELMAPSISPERLAQTTPAAPPKELPKTEMEIAIAALRAQVEAHSDYVGLNFAAEARKMHAGDAPERAIYGEAKPEEARKLIEDGVPVAPLPFLPKRKTN